MFNPSLLYFIMEDDKSFIVINNNPLKCYNYMLTNCNVNQLLCFILRLLVPLLPLSLSYVRAPTECRDTDNFRTIHLLRERYTFFSKTPFYRAPIYLVPRFTGPKVFPQKTNFMSKFMQTVPRFNVPLDLPCIFPFPRRAR